MWMFPLFFNNKIEVLMLVLLAFSRSQTWKCVVPRRLGSECTTRLMHARSHWQRHVTLARSSREQTAAPCDRVRHPQLHGHVHGRIILRWSHRTFHGAASDQFAQVVGGSDLLGHVAVLRRESELQRDLGSRSQCPVDLPRNLWGLVSLQGHLLCVSALHSTFLQLLESILLTPATLLLYFCWPIERQLGFHPRTSDPLHLHKPALLYLCFARQTSWDSGKVSPGTPSRNRIPGRRCMDQLLGWSRPAYLQKRAWHP